MLKNADIILTARLDGLLVGVSRAITDFAYWTYVSDLAVDAQYQRQGSDLRSDHSKTADPGKRWAGRKWKVKVESQKCRSRSRPLSTFDFQLSTFDFPFPRQIAQLFAAPRPFPPP